MFASQDDIGRARLFTTMERVSSVIPQLTVTRSLWPFGRTGRSQ